MFNGGVWRAVGLAIVLMTLTTFFVRTAVNTVGADVVRDAARTVVDIARSNANAGPPAPPATGPAPARQTIAR